jgi:hypothetical protein
VTLPSVETLRTLGACPRNADLGAKTAPFE